MDIAESTRAYESWLRSRLPAVIEADLEFKHQQMALAVFPFLRATFYRWAQRWPEVCPHLSDGPEVLAVGDLHVENYGTWRDAEGRLVWGINDFDEATRLPYTADLVRLATSAALATRAQRLSLSLEEAAEAIGTGYQDALACRGQPFVLAEHHPRLRRLATGGLRDPVRFWARMQALPVADGRDYPPDAAATATAALGAPATGVSVRSRRAGLGSLGRPRLVALATLLGGAVAREVKATLPSAWDWARGHPDPGIHYTEIVSTAVRDPDPCTGLQGAWLVRRLAPDCARIELSDLPAERDESALLHSMGFEVANVHLGSRDGVSAVRENLADLNDRHPKWLAGAAEKMAEDTEAEWRRWHG